MSLLSGNQLTGGTTTYLPHEGQGGCSFIFVYPPHLLPKCINLWDTRSLWQSQLTWQGDLGTMQKPATQRRLLFSLQVHPKNPKKKVAASEMRLRMVSADGAHKNGICVDAGNDTRCYSCVSVSTKQLHQDQHLIMSGADNNMQICCCWWTQGINKDIECWKLMIQGEEHYHVVTTWKWPIQEAASSWSGGSGGSSETIFERAPMAWLAVPWCCREVQNQAWETATLLFSLPTGHPPNLTAGHLDHPEIDIQKRWEMGIVEISA